LLEEAMMKTISQSALSQIHQGEKVSIASLHEGNELNRRLTSLGFTPGVDIEIMQNYGRGPMIVKVRGCKVALGRGEADKIQVDQQSHE
jgi:Fe2+ transport system protein FeoA